MSVVNYPKHRMPYNECCAILQDWAAASWKDILLTRKVRNADVKEIEQAEERIAYHTVQAAMWRARTNRATAIMQL